MKGLHKSILVRPSTPAEIDAMVNVHLRSFPGFFLTFLGRKFLKQLYQSILTDPSGIVWIVKEEDCLLGFVAGTLEPAGFYSRLIKGRIWGFASASIRPLLRRPGIFFRLWRALRKPAESKAIQKGTALLMSIAVDPTAQNQGVGKMLTKTFCDECVRQGALRVCLTTDQHGNDQGNRFYARMGFVLTRTFVTQEGRPMNEYVRILSAKPNAAPV
jgi:ribosomal protein S18 acetylase RimI-like enzyme